MDRGELARPLWADYGHHEVEVSYEEGANLDEALILCKKNPGHHQFIPIYEFKKQHLPPQYREDYHYNYIKAVADLTVLVSVRHISMKRPETYPEMKYYHPLKSYSGKLYPFYNNRGGNFLRLGTGWVLDVCRMSTEEGDGPCRCLECKSSSTPKQEWGEVKIDTAAHVVFDGDEARHTKCELFYDTSDRKGVKVLEGTGVWDSSTGGDWCDLITVTHDVELLVQLEEMCRRRDDLWEKVWGKRDGSVCTSNFSSSSSSNNNNNNNNNNNKSNSTTSSSSNNNNMSSSTTSSSTTTTTNNNKNNNSSNNKRSSSTNNSKNYNVPAVIVSHPHGCSKQVSIGEWTDPAEMRNKLYYSRYTTATCPGSSGAQVYGMGKDETWWMDYKTHHGSTDKPGVNKCGQHWWIDKPKGSVWPDFWTNSDSLATAITTLEFYNHEDSPET